MGRLYASGPSTAGDLAAACGLSRGAMTVALDRLERAEDVRRVRGETDRRHVRVEVTPRALELTEAIWGPIGAEGIEQLRQMSAEQLTFLRDFLRRGPDLQERHARRIAAMTSASVGLETGNDERPLSENDATGVGPVAGVARTRCLAGQLAGTGNANSVFAAPPSLGRAGRDACLRGHPAPDRDHSAQAARRLTRGGGMTLDQAISPAISLSRIPRSGFEYLWHPRG